MSSEAHGGHELHGRDPEGWAAACALQRRATQKPGRVRSVPALGSQEEPFAGSGDG